MNVSENNSLPQVRLILFNLFLALLVTLSFVKIIEVFQFCAVLRFIPLGAFIGPIAVVGLALVLFDSRFFARSSWFVSMAMLTGLLFLILMISGASQIILLLSILGFLGIIFVTPTGKLARSLS